MTILKCNQRQSQVFRKGGWLKIYVNCYDIVHVPKCIRWIYYSLVFGSSQKGLVCLPDYSRRFYIYKYVLQYWIVNEWHGIGPVLYSCRSDCKQ